MDALPLTPACKLSRYATPYLVITNSSAYLAHYILAEKKLQHFAVSRSTVSLSLSHDPLSRCHCLADSFCWFVLLIRLCFSRQNASLGLIIRWNPVKTYASNPLFYWALKLISHYLHFVVARYEKQSHNGYIETANTALRRYGVHPKQHGTGGEA